MDLGGLRKVAKQVFPGTNWASKFRAHIVTRPGYNAACWAFALLQRGGDEDAHEEAEVHGSCDRRDTGDKELM